MHRNRLMLAGIAVLLPLGALACGDDDGDETAATTSSTSAPATTAAPGSSSASTGATGSSSGEARPHTAMSEAELEVWQTDLNAVGCYAGPIDGKLGPLTESAIKAYQAARGLTVDGLLGPQTEGALQEDVAAGATVCRPQIDDGSTVPAGAEATLQSASYENEFTIGACTNAGETDLVLQGEGGSNLTLIVNAPTGHGTLSVSGGTESDGITLNGQISSIQVGDDGSFTVQGIFGPPNNAGEEFTLTGTCAGG